MEGIPLSALSPSPDFRRIDRLLTSRVRWIRGRRAISRYSRRRIENVPAGGPINITLLTSLLYCTRDVLAEGSFEGKSRVKRFGSTINSASARKKLMGEKQAEDLVTTDKFYGDNWVQGWKQSQFAPLIIHEIASVGTLMCLACTVSLRNACAHRAVRGYTHVGGTYRYVRKWEPVERSAGRDLYLRWMCIWERKIIHHVRGYPELAVLGRAMF